MIFTINASLSGFLEFALGDVVLKSPSEKQSLDIAKMAEKFLADNNVKWSDLTAIGVVTGPGSFTGIRLGMAYAKGLGLGLNIPVVGISAFDLYLAQYPDAFVAIDSGRPDLFVGAIDMEPGTMEIEQIETFQMKYARTVGHKPFDLSYAKDIVATRLKHPLTPAVPMYLRPSYAEIQKCCKD